KITPAKAPQKPTNQPPLAGFFDEYPREPIENFPPIEIFCEPWFPALPAGSAPAASWTTQPRTAAFRPELVAALSIRAKARSSEPRFAALEQVRGKIAAPWSIEPRRATYRREFFAPLPTEPKALPAPPRFAALKQVRGRIAAPWSIEPRRAIYR